jgi:MazG family protein
MSRRRIQVKEGGDGEDDRGRLQKLVEIMDRLRGPDGCPWDREQDYESLRGYLLEECYEVAQALDRGDREGLREELGDLLFQIVFLSRLASEEGRFDVRDVIRGIADKLIRRHPHVFGDAAAETPEEVVEHWDAIKRLEKSGDAGAAPAASLLDGVPAALPALLRAERLGARAARVGFDWERPEEILDKVEEEIGELRLALADGERTEIAGELGDLLFTLAMLARREGIDPEAALARTNEKFVRRFGWIEREAGAALGTLDLDELERLWARAKEALDE